MVLLLLNSLNLMSRVIKFDPWRWTRQGPALKGLCLGQYHFISVKLILKTPLKNLSDHGAAIASNNCKTQNIKKLVSSQINSNNTFSHSEHVFYTNSKLTWLSSCFNWGIQTPYGHMQCRIQNKILQLLVQSFLKTLCYPCPLSGTFISSWH